MQVFLVRDETERSLMMMKAWVYQAGLLFLQSSLITPDYISALRCHIEIPALLTVYASENDRNLMLLIVVWLIPVQSMRMISPVLTFGSGIGCQWHP